MTLDLRERIARRPERNASPDPMWQLPAADKAAAEPKRAAVAAVLRPGSNGPEVLLIRRAEHPNDPWSGHMAFPGGREDPCDADLFGTAVRETLEEVALDLTTNAALLGTLDDLPAVARGKRTPPGPAGSVQGRNDYSGWFAGDAQMAGDYLGYDGPCPPWNDSIVHRYRFTVHALDVARLDLAPGFDLAQLRAAIAGHELAQATLTGTYTLDPALRG